MKRLLLIILTSVSITTASTQKQVNTNERGAKEYISGKQVKWEPQKPKTPDQIWGKLFVDVQLNMVLGDNKSFVDAVPKYSREVILQKYSEALKSKDTSFKLKDFIF